MSDVHEVPRNTSAQTAAKQKKGFSVGPTNLPDGVHKRKVQKRKRDLIRSAKIKKEFARATKQTETPTASAGIELHPERQQMLSDPQNEQEVDAHHQKQNQSRRKIAPFQKAYLQAQQRKHDQELKQKHFEEMQARRAVRLKEREDFRHSLEKARRPDAKGQRRLGRESKLLPKMVENLFEKLERQKQRDTPTS